MNPEDTRKVERLQTAVEIVMETMEAGRVRDGILQHLNAAILGFSGVLAAAVCRRCGAPFKYSTQFFAERNLSRPQHCSECRHARRQERARAGLPNHP